MNDLCKLSATLYYKMIIGKITTFKMKLSMSEFH